MTDSIDESGFDFGSPRWREGDDTQRSVERERRLWDRRPPGQHGAIDAGRSVPGQQDDEAMLAADVLADEARAAGAEDESPERPPSPPFRADDQAR